jgi:hypothetical protein
MKYEMDQLQRDRDNAILVRICSMCIQKQSKELTWKCRRKGGVLKVMQSIISLLDPSIWTNL